MQYLHRTTLLVSLCKPALSHILVTDRPQAKQLSTFNLASKNARYSLLLDGKVLHLTALLSLRKFRDRGNKTGAILGFEALQKAGLGKLTSYKPNRGAALVSVITYMDTTS